MSETAPRTGPLSDLVVIDCTMALAGPFGSAILADLGADVIKVEPPTGDLSRTSPPIPEDFVNPAEGSAVRDGGCDFGGYFGSINRNKRSIVLDLKNEADRKAFLRMCEQADAVLENMRAGVMDRLGLSYETIRERNPQIVYAALRGFGDPRTGESPYADWPAFDIVAQAMGGFAHVNGPPGSTGYPGGASVGDLFPGALMALGVVAGIHNARRTGKGQFMDVAMVDGVNLLCESVFANFGSAKRHQLPPRGRHHHSLCPFGIYDAVDGGVAVAAPLPAQWETLCEVMERPDLAVDERTSDFGARRKHREFVEDVVAEWVGSRTRDEVVSALAGRVPCGPVQTAADIFESPHTAVREMVAEVELPGENEPVRVVGSPIKYTETKTGVRHRAPLLDEHRAEILAQFGFGNGTGTEGGAGIGSGRDAASAAADEVGRREGDREKQS